MNISPDEADEALAAIHDMTIRTRRSFAGSGAYVFLIVTGAVWLVGSLATQFLSGAVVAYVWIGASLLGSALSIVVGNRTGPRVRGPSSATAARRAGTFWLLLILFGAAIIAIARPTDGKQVTMLIVMFVMIGLALYIRSRW